MVDPFGMFALFRLFFGLFFLVVLATTVLNAVKLFTRTRSAGAVVEERSAEADRRYRATLERTILEAAAEHDGRVTPAAVVLRGRGIALQEVAGVLEELAQAGLCETDSDPEGHLYYRFIVDPSAGAPKVSPSDWVAAMTTRLAEPPQRMAGDSHDAPAELDDRLHSG